MSLAIDVDKVTAVLLADGWHEVASFRGGRSSFSLDAYEYIEPHPDDYHKDVLLHGGGMSGICATGACWTDKKSGNYMICPLTSVLAVIQQKCEPADE